MTKERVNKIFHENICINAIDYETSCTCKVVENELKSDQYGLKNIDFEEGDCIIDAGANIGIISIYLAKKFPFIKIYAFEPIPDNYLHLIKNIKINKITNINPFNIAITSDNRYIDMSVDFSNSGGGSEYFVKSNKKHINTYYNIPSTTLDNLFIDNSIKSCKLLKIDCEGAEYDILLNTQCLDEIEFISAEIHENSLIKNNGYDAHKLIKFIKSKFGRKFKYTLLRM